jgi:hypothetical protein
MPFLIASFFSLSVSCLITQPGYYSFSFDSSIITCSLNYNLSTVFLFPRHSSFYDIGIKPLDMPDFSPIFPDSRGFSSLLVTDVRITASAPEFETFIYVYALDRGDCHSNYFIYSLSEHSMAACTLWSEISKRFTACFLQDPIALVTKIELDISNQKNTVFWRDLSGDGGWTEAARQTVVVKPPTIVKLEGRTESGEFRLIGKNFSNSDDFFDPLPFYFLAVEKGLNLSAAAGLRVRIDSFLQFSDMQTAGIVISILAIVIVVGATVKFGYTACKKPEVQPMIAFMFNR